MLREEYPRPQLVRDQWKTLNGKWNFAFDDDNTGMSQHWEHPDKKLDGEIVVPFAYQSALSGIHTREAHDFLWYKREFTIPGNWSGKRILLHFGAVDYQARVYINGRFVGEHEGGSVDFSFDITDELQKGSNQLCVRVYDPHTLETIPRGKQSWTGSSHGIWYTNTSGIWQSVWLEPVSRKRVDNLRVTADIDRGTAEFEFFFSEELQDARLELTVRFGGEPIACHSLAVHGCDAKVTVDVFQNKTFRFSYHGTGLCWSPETPNLFDVRIRLLQDGEEKDCIDSYFGMRKVHIRDGMVFLNNRPYYQKLVLDQGYWPEGLLTAPGDDAFKTDIELCKAMGFNGCRKHQKVEDPRFLYWADKLGFLVWGEIPSAPAFSCRSVRRLIAEFSAEIERDYNHPCIVAWVPLNEGWGVMHIDTNPLQRHHSLSMYHTVHSLDDTRLVVSNDGWQMTLSDICAVHNYRHGAAGDVKTYEYFRESISTLEDILASMPAGKRLYAAGHAHRGEPVMLTEFGGIGYKADGGEGWGYTTAGSAEEYLAEYRRVMEAVYASGVLAGFCYTQLSDVEQEVNGLVTYGRRPKAPLGEIKRINDAWHPPISVQ